MNDGSVKIMDLDKLETHDRFEHIMTQSNDIGECCQDLINQRPFGNRPFYIFAHGRTDDDGVTKRMIWQPRLTKPKAQTNSMLFKWRPSKTGFDDNVEVVWMIPDRHLWPSFKKGMLMENEVIDRSTYLFEYARAYLERCETDDVSDEEAARIYNEIAQQARVKKAKESYQKI